MLIDLKLQSCEGINSASMSAISHSRMLEVRAFFPSFFAVNPFVS